MKKYYSLETTESTAEIYIYGDITSWEWFESDVSSYTLTKELQELDENIKTINVYINSYGGEVGEGLAIYNQLKRHRAKVNTFVDGFACSIASVIFMAGEERAMNKSSLLMVHNPWTWTAGNAKELRKTAEDLEIIGEAAFNSYKEHITISDEELTNLLDNETWLSPEDALSKGFASQLHAETKTDKASQSARKIVAKIILSNKRMEAERFTISASASDGGSIDPSGEQEVNSGESITFKATAKEGYGFINLIVDGEAVTENEYTFENVIENHSIEAKFEKVEEPKNEVITIFKNLI